MIYMLFSSIKTIPLKYHFQIKLFKVTETNHRQRQILVAMSPTFSIENYTLMLKQIQSKTSLTAFASKMNHRIINTPFSFSVPV